MTYFTLYKMSFDAVGISPTVCAKKQRSENLACFQILIKKEKKF
jgi:hypothetical protein